MELVITNNMKVNASNFELQRYGKKTGNKDGTTYKLYNKKQLERFGHNEKQLSHPSY